LLIFADNLAREFTQRAAAEEPAIGIHEGRRAGPALALRSVRIKDGPDRPASFAFCAIHFQARIPPVKSCRKLIHEPAAHLIDLDEILIIRHLQADGPGDALYGTIFYVLIPFS